MAEKNYQLKLMLTEALDSIKPGESLSFAVAGDEREAALESVRTLANKRGLSVSVADGGMTAIVTNKAQRDEPGT